MTPAVQPGPVKPPRSSRSDPTEQPPHVASDPPVQPPAPSVQLAPVPTPRNKGPSNAATSSGDFPGLPSVPMGGSVGVAGADEVNFDDLTRRFEELKKRK